MLFHSSNVALYDEEVLSSVVFGANGKVLLAQIVHN